MGSVLLLSVDDILINSIKNIRWISCQSYVITRQINLQWFYRWKFQKLSEKEWLLYRVWARLSPVLPSLLSVRPASETKNDTHMQVWDLICFCISRFHVKLSRFFFCIFFFFHFNQLIQLLIKTWSSSYYCTWPERLLRVSQVLSQGNKPSFLTELQISYQRYLKTRCCNSLQSLPKTTCCALQVHILPVTFEAWHSLHLQLHSQLGTSPCFAATDCNAIYWQYCPAFENSSHSSFSGFIVN